jgi:hypothetical protein
MAFGQFSTSAASAAPPASPARIMIDIPDTSTRRNLLIGPLADNAAYRLDDQAVLECFEDGALVLRVNDRHLFELNITARDILTLTDGARSARDIAAALAGDYQVSEDELIRDILELYTELAAEQIVVACEPPGDNRSVYDPK